MTLLAPPLFQDESKTRAAVLLYVILLLILASAALYSINILFIDPQQAWRLPIVIATMLLSAGLFWMMRRGHIQLTSQITTSMLWIIITLSAFNAGGIHATAFNGYIIVILCAGLLLGQRATYGFAIASMLSGLGMVYAESNALLPDLATPPAPLMIWIAQSLFFWATAFVLLLSTRNTNAALRRAQQEIVDRKQAERDVQEQRDFALQVMNALGQGLALIDNTNGFEFVNPAYAQMAGRSAEELIGKTLHEVIHPDDCAQVEAEQHSRQHGQTSTYTARMLRPDGESMHALMTSVPRWQHDQIAGSIVVAADLTELKHIEETQARLLSVLEVTPDFIATLDGREQLTYINRAGRVMLGLNDGEEATHISLHDCHPGWAYSIITNEGIPTAIRMGSWSGESVLLNRNGRETPVLQTVLAHQDAHGEVGYLSIVARDISESKRASERFRRIVESMPNTIVVINVDNAIVLVNSHAEKLFGYQRKELIGQSIELLVPERFRRQHSQFRKAFISTPQARAMGAGRELYALHKDGSELSVEIGLTPIHTDEGLLILSTITDITQRKRVQAQIEYQAHLLANVHDAIVATDELRILTAWNRAAEKLYGWSAAEVLGKPLQEIIRSDDSDSERQAALRALRESGHHQSVVLQHRRDGQPIYVEGSSIALRNKHGHSTGYVSVNRDITQRKQAEIALKESEALLRAVIDNLPLDFWACDREGRYIMQNPRSRAHWGNLIGKIPQEVHHVEDNIIHDWQVTRQRAFRGEIVHAEDENIVNGQKRYSYKTVAPIRDGEAIRGLIGVTIDVTEQRLMERAYRTLVEQSLQGILVLRDERIVFANSTMAEIFGLSVDELFGLSSRAITALVHHKDRELIRSRIQELASTSANPQRGEFRAIRKDGEIRWIEISAAHIEYQGQPAIQATAIDITDRKLAEQALQTSEARLHSVLETAPDYIMTMNLDGILLYINRMPPGFATHSTLDMSLFEFVLPESHIELRHAIELVRNTHAPYEFEAPGIGSENGRAWYLIRIGSITRDNHVTALTVCATDISGRKRAEHELLRRNEELALLYRAARAFNASLNRDQILTLALDQVREQLHVTACSAWLIDIPTDELVCVQASGAQRDVMLGWRLKRGQGLAGWAAEHGESVLVPDAQNDPRHFRGVDHDTGLTLHSILSVPLRVSQSIIGVLQVVDEKSKYFDTSDQMLVESLVATASIALENAQLYEEAQHHAADLERRVTERTLELTEANAQLQQEIIERARAEAAEHQQRTFAEALRDVSAALNSTLNLDEVLDHIIASVQLVVPHDAANLILIDEAGQVGSVRHRGRGEPMLKDFLMQANVADAQIAYLRNLAETSQTIIVEDVHTLPNRVSPPELEWIRSHVAAPIRLSGRLTGYLGLYSEAPGYFLRVHADRLRVFADQAAVAIRNAQLFKQSQELAVLEERQRLARDLHDAVSQTLFSASVMSETLPRLWERNPQQVRQSLDELHRLTRGALAEMRTLLLELRPAALASTPLSDLLLQLSEAVHGRSRVHVKVVSEGECILPLDAKTALYRIAQEALNNVVKHSQAREVQVKLHCRSSEIVLRVCDDGRGFEPARTGKDRLGLGIMQERADAIGARFELNSQPGHGTELIVTWSTDSQKD